MDLARARRCGRPHRRARDEEILYDPALARLEVVPFRNNSGGGFAGRYKIRRGSELAMVHMKREFPQHPILCVGGVVIKRDSVLLIRRGSEPHKGEWSLPGGMVELGEKLEAAVRREIREETGLRVKPLEMLMVFERIMRKGKKVRFHYAVIDFRCRSEGGKLQPASDAMDARWVRRADLEDYNLSPAAQRVIARAFDGPGRGRRLS